MPPGRRKKSTKKAPVSVTGEQLNLFPGSYYLVYKRASLSTLSVCLCLRNAALLLLLEKKANGPGDWIGKVGIRWESFIFSLCSKSGMANLSCTSQTKLSRHTIHMLFYNSICLTLKVNKGDIGFQYLYIVPGKIPITH